MTTRGCWRHGVTEWRTCACGCGVVFGLTTQMRKTRKFANRWCWKRSADYKQARRVYLRKMSSPGSQTPRADELRAMLRSEGLLLEVTEAADARRLLADQTPEERAEEAEAMPVVDPVAQWLDDGGFFGGDYE